MNAKIKVNELWRWDGKISRGRFVFWAAVLFALKYNLDRLLLVSMFGREWSVFSYFSQPFPGVQYLTPATTRAELVTLLVASLPFLWIGIVLCIKRLRSAQFPLWLAVLFVVPVVKWFLFVALGLAPERKAGQRGDKQHASWLPKSAWASAALAVCAAAPLALGAVALGVGVYGNYGWGLFVGTPFSMGFFAALIHGAREERRLRDSLLVAAASVVVAGAVFLAFAFEGIICLLMAAPLALVLALIGGFAAHAIRVGSRPRVTSQPCLIPILAIPLMLGSEKAGQGPPPIMEVITAVDVDAPIETVWGHVVEFTELPPPRDLLFRVGIAYPIRAEIQGHGPGAIRNCIFSTGPFVEPIEVWDEPHLLKFSVASSPPPMEEWTPYRQIHPPHLHGFLASERGQFRLIRLAVDQTRLEGTTWYRHTMWPARYWEIWSDQIIHAIHRRVLEHVKQLAERDTKRTQ